MEEILEERGFDPIGTILAEVGEISSYERIQVCLDLLPYLHPKKKQIDLTMEQSERLQELERVSSMTDEELARQAEIALRSVNGGSGAARK